MCRRSLARFVTFLTHTQTKNQTHTHAHSHARICTPKDTYTRTHPLYHLSSLSVLVCVCVSARLRVCLRELRILVGAYESLYTLCSCMCASLCVCVCARLRVCLRELRILVGVYESLYTLCSCMCASLCVCVLLVYVCMCSCDWHFHR